MEGVYNQIFGDPPGPKELLRVCQRELKRDIRAMQLQCGKMELTEKVSLLEAKKEARAGNMTTAKAKMRLAARTRVMIDKFNGLAVNLEGILMQLGMMSAVAAMQNAMKSAVKAMWRMNSSVSLPMMERIAREFDKQQNLMEMKEELMGESLDSTMGSDTLESAEDEIYNRLMDELALEHEALLSGGGGGAGARGTATATPTHISGESTTHHK